MTANGSPCTSSVECGHDHLIVPEALDDAGEGWRRCAAATSLSIFARRPVSSLRARNQPPTHRGRTSAALRGLKTRQLLVQLCLPCLGPLDYIDNVFWIAVA